MNHSKQAIKNQENFQNKVNTSTLFQAEAWKNACIKLLPQHAIRNPVMAIVWLGTLITLVSTLMGKADLVFGLWVTFILFITVLFANYAEAVAEAKGRGQASSLRQARQNLVIRSSISSVLPSEIAFQSASCSAYKTFNSSMDLKFINVRKRSY